MPPFQVEATQQQCEFKIFGESGEVLLLVSKRFTLYTAYFDDTWWNLCRSFQAGLTLRDGNEMDQRYGDGSEMDQQYVDGSEMDQRYGAGIPQRFCSFKFFQQI